MIRQNADRPNAAPGTRLTRRSMLTLALGASAALAAACSSAPAATPAKPADAPKPTEAAKPAAAASPASAASPATGASPVVAASPATGASPAASPAAATSSGAAPAAPAASSKPASGRIIYASGRPQDTADPRLVHFVEGIGLMQQVTEPLVRLDSKMQLIPMLATSWEPVDPTSWRFKLRTGVKFTNGEPFDAQSVKFTLDEYRKTAEKYPWYSLWPDGMPEGQVVDAQTVIIKTVKPVSATVRNLALLYMMPPVAGAQAGYGDNPIGTGAFKFVELQKDTRFVLEANPNYWGGSPGVQTVTYRPIPDPSARMTAVQTGEIDLAVNLPPDLIPVLEQNKDLTVQKIPGVRLAHFPFNFKNKTSPVADVRVRRALSLAVDGDAIVAQVLAGAGTPLSGPVPSTLFGAADVGGYPKPDLDRAKALLAEAGVPASQEIVMIFTQGEFIKDRECAEVIQAQVGKIGLRLRIENLDGGAYRDRRAGSDWDVAVNGVSAANGDANFVMSQWAGPAVGYGGTNPKTDAAMQLMTTTQDEKQYVSRMADAQKLFWDDVPYLWGFTVTDVVAMRKRAVGVEPVPGGWYLFDKASVTS